MNYQAAYIDVLLLILLLQKHLSPHLPFFRRNTSKLLQVAEQELRQPQIANMVYKHAFSVVGNPDISVLPFSTSFALLHRQVLFVDPYSIAGAFFLQTLDDEIVPFVLFHPVCLLIKL